MSIRSLRGCAALLLASCTTLALAAPPAPQPAARAGGVKQLRFEWPAVPGATSYELWFRQNPGSSPVRYFQFPGTQRSAINNVSVHLLDWNNARYWVNACDSTGCTSSAQLAVSNYMLDTIGLIQSPTPASGSQFGTSVALSADGTTLAVASPFENTENPAFPKGSAYVYRKSGSTWIFQSAIPFDVARDARTTNPRVTLSGNGNVLAIGLPGDAHHGAQSTIGFGSAKMFRFVEGNGWRHEATIAMSTSQEWNSASDLQLDEAGTTLAVKTVLGQSGVYIYTYDSAGTWSHTGTALGHGADVNDGTSCGEFALSGDGRVVTYACGSFEPSDSVYEVHAAPSWGIRDTLAATPGFGGMKALSLDRTGDLLARQVSSGSDRMVEVYRRVNGVYQREGVLRPGAWGSGTGDFRFGDDAVFSADGKLLAVSDPSDRGTGTGALTPPLTAGTAVTGAVYVFERRTNGWNLRRVVKPGRADAGFATGTFGRSIAFGDNGKVLAVGQPGANNNSGAAWLY